ncbi:MAG: hypothetical protein AMXMBFR64_17350 [Myxococcales bacterium]
MIDLAAEHLAEVRRILSFHVPDCEVWAFGSRVHGRSQRYSDLDLALVGPGSLGRRELERLRDAFSASDLPFLVDVVDWHDLSPAFREVIERGYEVIQSAR